MASFSITGNDHESVTVKVTGISSGDTVRIFVRLADDATDATVDKSYTATGTTMTKTVYGLEPETNYLVNVQTDGATWLGAWTFFTDAAPETYIIYLDDDGDDVPEDSMEVEAYEELPSVTIPERSGYVFRGYWTLKQSEADGREVQYYDENGDPTQPYYDGSYSSITLYAYWQEVGTAFSWTYEKVEGEPFNLTADEWNDLAAFVNSKRSRAYSFTVAVKDYPFTAAMYNEMVEAIGAGTEVEKGDTITADLMNELVTNANNM